MSSFNMLWTKALKIIEQKSMFNGNKVSFDTWIKELKPAFADTEYCYFETATKEHKDMLNERFFGVIENAMHEVSEEIPDSIFSSKLPVFLTHDEIVELKRKRLEEKTKPSNIQLNPNFTFDTFVRGSSNEFAYAAAHSVSQRPGKAYNPLFIYGGVGLGKTHLMNAIGNEISTLFPDYKITYVTCETFTNELIEAIQKNTTSAFRNKYRKSDILLIDDIQFIADKTSTQEEFFHTFNTLKDSDKQIVISSDKPPTEIPNLEKRLVSRFSGGLPADIGLPDYEMRAAILKNKLPGILEMAGSTMTVSDEVISYIASKSNTNIRDLEGALKRVVAYSPIVYSDNPYAEIDLAAAQIALKDFFAGYEPKKQLSPNTVLKTISNYYNIPQEDIVGRKKNREIVIPRQIAMYVLRTELDLTYESIGKIFGGKDHSTVKYAEAKIKEMIKEDSDFSAIVDDLIHKIKE